ncbi:MAG: hypothetical protein IKM33_02870 [Clostridia bacterium]|nr:hypothetical protein [Clostridia bacterium]
MIEFKGSVSHKCERYIQKQEGKNGLFASIAVVILFIIPVIFLVIKFLDIPWYITIPLCFPLVAFFVGYSYFAPFSKKTRDLILPQRIVITDDGYITSYGAKFQLTESIATITMVVDMGDWYHISWGRKLGLGRFVCEKDLLVQGTIGDFEKLFEGRLTRK